MRASRLPLVYWGLALLGVAALPWWMLEDGIRLGRLAGFAAGEGDLASALRAATGFGRFWLWPVILAPLVALPALWAGASRRLASTALIAAGALGLVGFIAQGMAVGINGWASPWLEARFGPLSGGQLGIGLGGALSAAMFLMMLMHGLALAGRFGGDRFVAGSVGVLVAAIILFTIWPVMTMLSQAFAPPKGLSLADAFSQRFLAQKSWGLACLQGQGACGVAWNTLALALATATTTTFLGLCFALIVTRTGFPLKKGLRLLTVLPIITPPFVIGLGLILIFGRSGIVNQAASSLFGLELGRWIYGFDGVWLAQVFSFTPTAFLVLIGIVQGISPTMEEAAQTLRASPTRSFRAVTLPARLRAPP